MQFKGATEVFQVPLASFDYVHRSEEFVMNQLCTIAFGHCRSSTELERKVNHVGTWLNQHSTDTQALHGFMSWPTSALPTKDLDFKGRFAEWSPEWGLDVWWYVEIWLAISLDKCEMMNLLRNTVHSLASALTRPKLLGNQRSMRSLMHLLYLTMACYECDYAVICGMPYF